ncbi:MAG: radical SAM protein [Candidatus Omnitrophica bacterium]|jgi:oxygen-independent coproporphyrinogen-3 oxidase|nr:radical SAM protein [Candidatus Omnitrophota bacterium]MDD3987578.1 radical SAM protein [Candidatus Omnitrophota bacterium]MDD4981689.1 radical SAM protein [Candidatus Omnitrophota bacterium]MDD5664820.1 radical SAM protein [Candidatus Omnitrophota bacterium]
MELTAERLNLYRFLTLKLADDDLYPHYRYGENFTLDEIKFFWRRTVKMILDKKAPKKLGLYIHIPFCHQKCNYCMCDSYVPFSYGQVSEYLALLKKEIGYFSDLFKDVSFTSIYFGGGSPSFLRPVDLDNFLRFIYGSFSFSHDCQVIFEGTPTDLNEEYIDLLMRHGVNRFTIGVQSLDSKVIRNIKRPQTREKFVRIFKYLRKLGAPWINVDLIAGLEGQTKESFVSDVKLMLDLGVDMVHASGFSPLPHTPFSRQGKKFTLENERLRDEMMEAFEEITKNNTGANALEDGAGYKDGAENLQETDLRKENSSLLGIGYSAQSHAFAQAWYEHPCLTHLKKRPTYNKLPLFRGVRSSLKEEMIKFIYNNLQSGFSRRLFRSLFGMDATKVFKREFLLLSKLGKVNIKGDRIIFQVGPEHLIYSKIFYSKKRLRDILKIHGHSYRENKDYRKELERFYPEIYLSRENIG